jgi:ADP-dependent phosphofructokinase/glucokinase
MRLVHYDQSVNLGAIKKVTMRLERAAGKSGWKERLERATELSLLTFSTGANSGNCRILGFGKSGSSVPVRELGEYFLRNEP